MEKLLSGFKASCSVAGPSRPHGAAGSSEAESLPTPSGECWYRAGARQRSCGPSRGAQRAGPGGTSPMEPRRRGCVPPTRPPPPPRALRVMRRHAPRDTTHRTVSSFWGRSASLSLIRPDPTCGSRRGESSLPPPLQCATASPRRDSRRLAQPAGRYRVGRRARRRRTCTRTCRPMRRPTLRRPTRTLTPRAHGARGDGRASSTDCGASSAASAAAEAIPTAAAEREALLTTA